MLRNKVSVINEVLFEGGISLGINFLASKSMIAGLVVAMSQA